MKNSITQKRILQAANLAPNESMIDKLVNIQTPNEVIPQNTSTSNDSILNDILNELKDINNKLNK